MNVTQTMEGVNSCVSILRDHTNVSADQGSYWIAMVSHVQVGFLSSP